jgi:hypothetical protein
VDIGCEWRSFSRHLFTARNFRLEKKMIYLALGEDGEMHNIGDCGDWESANEICEDADLYFHYLASLDEWKKYAEIINNVKEINSENN